MQAKEIILDEVHYHIHFFFLHCWHMESKNSTPQIKTTPSSRVDANLDPSYVPLCFLSGSLHSPTIPTCLFPLFCCFHGFVFFSSSFPWTVTIVLLLSMKTNPLWGTCMGLWMHASRRGIWTCRPAEGDGLACSGTWGFGAWKPCRRERKEKVIGLQERAGLMLLVVGPWIGLQFKLRA